MADPRTIALLIPIAVVIETVGDGSPTQGHQCVGGSETTANSVPEMLRWQVGGVGTTLEKTESVHSRSIEHNDANRKTVHNRQ